jgi:6-phosphofructokinase 1
VRIGVFCSGGDAPGMNACVRAVVRSAIQEGHDAVGIRRGYRGLLNGDFQLIDGEPLMRLGSVSDWVKFGGAKLYSSRCDEFRTEGGLLKATEVLRRNHIDALIPIGGDGTFRGAVELARHWDGQIVGCPGTIDNDLIGSDHTIGFSTAVQTAVEAVDKIRDTASSHERIFLIEVMGRHSGYIAAYTALASGAEIACIPETPTDIPQIVRDFAALKSRGSTSIMVIVAEGDEQGGAEQLNQRLEQAGCPYQRRVVILGHLQRGGTPAPEDRILAGQLGSWAVRAILDGQTGIMVGKVCGQRKLTPFPETFATHRPIPEHVLETIRTLAR